MAACALLAEPAHHASQQHGGRRLVAGAYLAAPEVGLQLRQVLTAAVNLQANSAEQHMAGKGLSKAGSFRVHWCVAREVGLELGQVFAAAVNLNRTRKQRRRQNKGGYTEDAVVCTSLDMPDAGLEPR